MTEPTVADAIAVLRDPASLTMNGQRHELRSRGVVEVSGTRVLNELQTRGAPSREAALSLALEALAAIDGEDVSPWRESHGLGRRATPRAQRIIVFLVPIDDSNAA